MLGWFRAEAERASFSNRRASLRVADDLRRQNLDRDVAREPRVPRPVDLPHPARAKERGHFVRTEPRTG